MSSAASWPSNSPAVPRMSVSEPKTSERFAGIEPRASSTAPLISGAPPSSSSSAGHSSTPAISTFSSSAFSSAASAASAGAAALSATTALSVAAESAAATCSGAGASAAGVSAAGSSAFGSSAGASAFSPAIEYSEFMVPITASLAKRPVNRDTEAGQFSFSTPNGSNTGVIALPMVESKLFSESPLPAVNSKPAGSSAGAFSSAAFSTIPKLFRKPSIATASVITLPARQM